jgi:catechol 2,3-dioxygenase-like lactoylglutathione lyase family enzyme
MSNQPSGSIGRRQALAALGAGVLLAGKSGAAASAPFEFGALDHVALSVSGVPSSVHFYTRIFGNTVMKEKQNDRHYVKLGPCYAAIAPPGQGQDAHVVNHFCPGIRNFQLADVKRRLDQLGVQYRESTGVGLFVPDPDGTLVQLWTENSWNELGSTAAPASIPSSGDPVFQPAGIDHILVAVSDPEKSTAFYEKILGPVTRRAPSPLRIWFQTGKSRVGLAPVANGQKPGVDHFCLLAKERFDREAVMKRLTEAGATLLPSDVAGDISFRDVEGIHVQIVPPSA